MRNNSPLLGLPPMSLNAISGGLFVFIVCLGLRVARAPEIDLKIANTQLVIDSSADRLTELALQLDEQAKVIEEKEKAYKQLQLSYEQSLTRVQEDRGLKKAFEKIEKLPELESTEEIQKEISETKTELTEILSK